MLAWLRKPGDTHGDAGCVAFVGQLETELEAEVVSLAEPTEEERRQQEADRVQREREERARDELRQCHVCDECGRLRTGTRWVKAKPPVGFFVWHDRCPDCD